MRFDEEARDRAKRLFQFVKELIELRRVQKRKYSKDDIVVPLDDLPAKPDCSFIARGDFGEEDQETWLEVRSPRIENYPEPPPILADWFDPSDLADAAQDVPALLTGLRLSTLSEEADDADDELAGPAEHPVDQAPPPEVSDAWETYIENKWWPWKERASPKYRAKKLYDDLFRMYQRQHHLGETFEVVVGFGLLTWRPTAAVEIQRHMVTVGLSLELDARRQILSLRPNADGIELRLEEDMLEPTQRPQDQIRKRVAEQLGSLDLTLWSTEQLQELLKEYCNALSADAVFDASSGAPKEVGESPVVTFAPALILRRRGNEGLLGLAEATIKSIEEGTEIPNAVLQQVSLIEDREWPNESDTEDSRTEDEETFFPLPANREQRKIVEHLRRANGIVVEGPPGTGKSQTIANLVSHLLATGKRVLVTSHTARALQVLRDKIPESIRPLCVQALSNDAQGMEALEFSVKGITDRQLTWNPEDSRTETIRLARELDLAREQLQTAIYQQRSIREAEVFHHHRVAGRYSGTLAQIARQLKGEEAKLGIISDQVDAQDGPPCSAEDFQALLTALNSSTSDLDEEAQEPPDTSALTSPERFEELVGELGGLESGVAKSSQRVNEELVARLRRLPTETRANFAADFQVFATRLQTLRQTRTERWLEDAASDIFSEKDRSWSGRLKDTQEKLAALRSLPLQALEARLTGHESQDADALRHNANILIGHLRTRKAKGLGFRFLLPTHVKSALGILERVRINGVPCTDLKTLEALLNWTEAARFSESLDREWANFGATPNESFHRRMERYDDLCEPLVELLQLFEGAKKLAQMLRNSCGDSGPTWLDVDDLSSYQQAFLTIEATEKLAQKEGEWKECCHLIDAACLRIPDAALQGAISSAMANRSPAVYRRCVDSLNELRKEWERNKRATSTLQRLAATVPKLALHVSEAPAYQQWPILAERWDEVWAWAGARVWLDDLVAPDADRKASQRVQDEQKRIHNLLGQLASARAWAYCFDRMTNLQRQSLLAWANQVRLVGRTGRGRYANQHRLAARVHLAECQPAIPA